MNNIRSIAILWVLALTGSAASCTRPPEPVSAARATASVSTETASTPPSAPPAPTNTEPDELAFLYRVVDGEMLNRLSLVRVYAHGCARELGLRSSFTPRVSSDGTEIVYGDAQGRVVRASWPALEQRDVVCALSADERAADLDSRPGWSCFPDSCLRFAEGDARSACLAHPRGARLHLQNGRVAASGQPYDFHMLTTDGSVRFAEEDDAFYIVSATQPYHRVAFAPTDDRVYSYMGGAYSLRPSGMLAVILEYGEPRAERVLAEVDPASGRVTVRTELGRMVPGFFDFAGQTLVFSRFDDARAREHLYARALPSRADRLLVEDAREPVVLPTGARIPEGPCIDAR